MRRSIPWFIRLPLGLPILGIMVWAQYTAFSGKRDFEALQAEEQSAQFEDEYIAPAAPAHNTSPEAQHYIGASSSSEEGDELSVWVMLAAGGAGLSVLAACLALSGLIGASAEQDKYHTGWEPDPF